MTQLGQNDAFRVPLSFTGIKIIEAMPRGSRFSEATVGRYPLRKINMITTFLGIAHPWLCDSMGHLNTRYYMSMFDDASAHYLAHIGWHPSQIKSENRGWADVSGYIKYESEVREGELVEIRSATSKLGTKSLTLYSEMRNVVSHDTHATIYSTIVHFDLANRCAIPIPDLYRGKANELMVEEVS